MNKEDLLKLAGDERFIPGITIIATGGVSGVLSRVAV
jgi:hypothetical protein